MTLQQQGRLPRSARPASKNGGEARIRQALLHWFRTHRRPLPWRATSDPYRVWVSEVMLQQTQVAAAVPYYERFLRAFPTVQHLARARLERVLQLWSGLGYYRRARSLHAAARTMVAKFGGKFPATLDEARQLPGVGEYTAAAVLSIAYGVPLAALDGNVARVVARLEARAGSLAQPAFRRATEARIATLLPARHPGDFNQALMELGQTVCLPRAPRCPVCPLGGWCRARNTANPEAFPSPRPRRAKEESHLAAALIFRAAARRPSDRRASSNGSGSVLVVRGLAGGLMTDLWNFPSAFGASATEARARLEDGLHDISGNPVQLGPELARMVHHVTYREIQVKVYEAFPSAWPANGFRWLNLSRFHSAAVSQLARKIAGAVPQHARTGEG